MKPSDFTRKEVAALEEFAAGFQWHLDNSQTEHYMGTITRHSKVPQSVWAEGYKETGQAAGRAAPAMARFGQPGMANPIADWLPSLVNSRKTNPLEIQSAIDAAIGAGRAQLDVAVERERGLIGGLSSFIRWPQRLREAVGGSPAQQRAASVVGVGGQVFAGVVVAAIVATVGRLASIWLG